MIGVLRHPSVVGSRSSSSIAGTDISTRRAHATRDERAANVCAVVLRRGDVQGVHGGRGRAGAGGGARGGGARAAGGGAGGGARGAALGAAQRRQHPAGGARRRHAAGGRERQPGRRTRAHRLAHGQSALPRSLYSGCRLRSIVGDEDGALNLVSRERSAESTPVVSGIPHAWPLSSVDLLPAPLS